MPTKSIVPSLLYAGTQNNTLEYLIMINASCGHPKEARNGQSDFARRYHANTGPQSKIDAVAMLGYIPLQPNELCVQEEVDRQKQCGMSPCDCSNCRPEEAEALWLAQPALTVENFDEALAMNEMELLNLVEELPDPPVAPAADIQHVAHICVADDPIINIPLLEKLVTRWVESFNQLFYLIFTEPSDLGPPDYFGRDMAWDLAKNIDIITSPSDFALLLGSETLKGQFDCLFVVFCQWKSEFATGALLADTAARRASTIRPNNSSKVPQSCEGFKLSKQRAEANKLAIKAAREESKREAALAKAEAKAQRDQERGKAEARKRETKGAVRVNSLQNPLGHQQATRKTSKCVADVPLEGVSSRTKAFYTRNVLIVISDFLVQSTMGLSSSTHDNNTSAAPHRKRDDRPATLSARLNLTIFRTPCRQMFVTCGGGRKLGPPSPKHSAAYVRNNSNDAQVIPFKLAW
ncbi:uncharacterized protein MELLADRAFT_69672 [Melampsora larici-populina 98AG31]|uniref:Uncharacterized protein n=1 Tax=Melampsora larici-populina (strain 98AG31 / pathotype 3-4-7) TaxID=747676 RepID=F4SBP7_MELLP|nr:uncharacterized protein MELLADRAFT_69672 [Melampsora larici-populina 98AG31]EGF97935.1 hypothetical protein MELLADRAFT_69672 [Melampsora larici-populina 98AG31]